MKDSDNLPTNIDFPCSYCCRMMTFPKKFYVGGGIVKCPKCGMRTRFKPHPDVGTKKKRKRSKFIWGGGNPDKID